MSWKFQSIVEEVKDMVGSILEGRAPLVDPSDCLEAVKVVEMALESASAL
jgi:predicted dehydrogenase